MSNTPTQAPAMTFAEAVIACALYADKRRYWSSSIELAHATMDAQDMPPDIRSALAQGQGAALPDMAVLEAYSDQRTTDLRAKVAELERDLADMRERKNMHKKQEYAYMDDYFREKSRADKAERELANGAPELWQERNNLEQDRDALLAKCERLERESNTAGRRLEQLAAELAALQSAPKPARGMGERITASEASALIDAGWVPREAAIASHSDLFKEDGAECVDRRVNIWLATRQQGGAK